jgi:hypothetical protein
LAELRRERESAARAEASGADAGGNGSKMARGADGRARPLDKADLPGLGVGRRYLPVRQR